MIRFLKCYGCEAGHCGTSPDPGPGQHPAGQTPARSPRAVLRPGAEGRAQGPEDRDKRPRPECPVGPAPPPGAAPCPGPYREAGPDPPEPGPARGTAKAGPARAGYGSPIHPDNVSGQFTKRLARAGFSHVTFHGLRHTHATLLLEWGVHPKIVAERLGHSTTRLTLDTYSHVTPTVQDSVARMVDEKLFG